MTERQQRLLRSRRNAIITRWVVFIMTTLILISLSIAGYFTVFRKITAMLVKVETAQAGAIENSFSSEADIDVVQALATAPTQGRLENLVPEGEKVRKGTLVGHFYPLGGGEAISIRAPASGVVCFHPEYEAPSDASVLEKKALELWEQKKAHEDEETFAFDKGLPMFRIIDNLSPIRLNITLPEKVTLNQGDKLMVRQGGNDLGYGICQNVYAHASKIKAVIDLNEFNLDLVELKRSNLEFISYRYEGIILPTSVLIQQGDQVGVYIIKNGTVSFTPVEVLYRLEDKAIISGISEGDLYVVNPDKVYDGAKLD